MLNNRPPCSALRSPRPSISPTAFHPHTNGCRAPTLLLVQNHELILNDDPDNMSPQEPSGSLRATEFVQMNNPADGSWRREVRSHIARGRHARTRERRVREHQERLGGKLERGKVDNQPQRVPNPESLFRLPGIDPFDCLVRQTTRFDAFLLNHCTSLLAEDP